MPVCFSEEFLYDGSKGCVSEKLFAIADGVIHLKGGHAYQDNPLAVDGLPVSRDSTTDETVSPSAVVETRSVQTHAPQPKQQKNGSWGVYRYYFAAAGLWTSAFFAGSILVSSFCGQFPSKLLTNPPLPLGLPLSDPTHQTQRCGSAGGLPPTTGIPISTRAGTLASMRVSRLDRFWHSSWHAGGLSCLGHPKPTDRADSRPRAEHLSSP